MGRVKDPNVNRKSSKKKHTVHWFRKGLRLSDNPALLRGIRRCETFRCIFILDPWFAGSSNVGTNKWRFLLQCLEDLDTSLRRLNSRLFVVRGQPADVLPNLFKEWNTTYFTFEEDPEPFGRVRDLNIVAMCKEMGITVAHEHSHTLYNLDKIIEANGGKPPLTYKQFQRTIEMMEAPVKPVPTITMELLTMGNSTTPIDDDHDEKYGVPTLEELGFDTEGLKTPVWVGGETEALSRLERHLERKAWVASFGRPKMTPQSLLASQTGLSPYLRFGCLSTRLFYHALADLYRKIKKSEPPLSLHGQLLWREFFYCAATKNPSFDKMYGNPICVQIPWDRNEEALAKWASAHTGFPWIDAIMTQLREEGWIHHLARHAVACFLTRGDLWVSWEEGMKVFDELLLDADWSVNAGTWLWLSCSSFFQQFFHCYCPVKFGRKADANGDYIRRYLPVLKNYPTRYIHEPWTAPEAVQKSAKCIVGVDYPKPMCNHAHVSKINMERMKQVYAQLAQYRRNGQTGPGIPNELLSQMKSVPKVPRNSGVLMGPPDPPEAPRFIKKEEKHVSQNMQLKMSPIEHADNQQILKQSSNRNLRQQDSMLNMQHIILNNTIQQHALMSPVMPAMSEAISPQSDGISPLVMSPVSHQQLGPSPTSPALYQNCLTQVPSSSGSMLLSIPYSSYSTASSIVSNNANTASLPILSSDMLLPVATSHGSNEDIANISNVSNVSQNSSIEAINSQSGNQLEDRLGGVNYNYNTALAEGFFDSNQQQT